jgi:DNA-binding transcriptional ArsR family regulator
MDADVAKVAGLLADPARARMLDTLLAGRALAAGELARHAGVSPPTASAHLGRLLDGGLLAVETQGRHRYYRLAGPAVAEAMEALSLIAPPLPVRSLRQSQRAEVLRFARSCYDHLAGVVGVALADALLRAGTLRAAGGRDYEVTPEGEAALAGLGVEVAALRRQRRVFARRCLDWTERTPHVSGALGAALLARLLELGWLARGRVPRGLVLTDAGRDGLAAHLACHVPTPPRERRDGQSSPVA